MRKVRGLTFWSEVSVNYGWKNWSHLSSLWQIWLKISEVTWRDKMNLSFTGIVETNRTTFYYSGKICASLNATWHLLMRMLCKSLHVCLLLFLCCSILMLLVDASSHQQQAKRYQVLWVPCRVSHAWKHTGVLCWDTLFCFTGNFPVINPVTTRWQCGNMHQWLPVSAELSWDCGTLNKEMDNAVMCW